MRKVKETAKVNDVVVFVKEVALHQKKMLRKSVIDKDAVVFVKKFLYIRGKG